MTNQRLIFISSIIYFSCVVHGMDTPENKSGEGKTALTRRRSTDKVTKPYDDIDGATIIDIVSVDDKKEKRKSPVPPLSLNSNQQLPLAALPKNMGPPAESSSRSSQKTSIESKADLLKKTASIRSAGRSAGPRVRKRVASTPVLRNAADKKKDPEEEPRKRASLLPKAIAQQIAGAGIDLSDDNEKMYTEQQVWAFAGIFNPALLEFAMRHSIADLEELASYAEVMEENRIEPRALLEHIYQNHEQPGSNSWSDRGLQYIFGDAHEQNLDRLDKMYEKMRKENPDGYKLVMLELIKGAADEAAGLKKRSAIADTHAALQNKQSTDQVTQIRQQWIGLALTGMGLVAGWVTSGIQYFSPPVATPSCVCNSTNSTA